MKYGESTFDILYLLFAVVSGIVILVKAKDRPGRLMGIAALILGCGDAFHLVPRVLNYFIDADFKAALDDLTQQSAQGQDQVKEESKEQGE